MAKFVFGEGHRSLVIEQFFTIEQFLTPLNESLFFLENAMLTFCFASGGL